MRREIADLYADVVGQHSRYDRLLERIERIEKRPLWCAAPKVRMTSVPSNCIFSTR